jgi:Lon protease-like protein
MEELALFRIGRVLLPGAQFPLQIFKHKKATQAMFVKEAKRSGTVGVVFSPEGSEGSFATCGCEAQIESLTHLDDGRLIVECTGTRRFHVEGIRQAEPYVKAHVKFDEDDGGAAEEDLIASCEVDCWKTLQEVIWLCVEVWDKRQVSPRD